jgi:hypothetical protein
LIVVADFFAVEVWTRRGLQRFFVLFVMELSTCKVEIAGIASAASGLWTNQIGRNLTDAADGILNGKRYLIVVLENIQYPEGREEAYEQLICRIVQSRSWGTEVG